MGRFRIGAVDFDVEVKRARAKMVRLTVWWSGVNGTMRISGLITDDEAATLAAEFGKAARPAKAGRR